MKKIIILKISYKTIFSILENGFVRTLAIVCFIFFATSTLTNAQWLPVILTETGDTLDYEYTFPPPDSTFVPGEIIIRFRKNALNMHMLCFPLQGPYDVKKKKSNDEFQDYPYESRENIMNQRFYVDDLIADNNLLAAVKNFGGDTLRRITYADPCRDTISITRLGDTLKCEDYLWMTLQMNNDTNEVAASVYLTQFMQYAIIMAQLNFYYKPDFDAPSDHHYSTRQLSLHDDMIGMETAWNYTTGEDSIIVGIIDDGINYEHCDFGSQTGMGLGEKVTWGKYYYKQNDDVIEHPSHGTPVAGIIGALTNQTYSECGIVGGGIAGIAGGWGDEIGCQLHAYRVQKPDEQRVIWATEYIIAAIREAAADREGGSGYGQANHVLNFSASINEKPQPDNALIDAVNWAYEHGVTFVNSRGNGRTMEGYPGAYFTQKAINVGGGDANKNLLQLFPFGNNMDLLAPAHRDQIYTTYHENNKWISFSATSAAAPHVSGVVALLRSFAINQVEDYPDIVWQNLEPEDYEGMLLASAEDRILSDNPEHEYLVGYDEYTGWGHLQADNLFNMINDGYRITHFTVDANSYPNNPAIFDVEIGEWSEPYKVYFQNNSIGDKGFQPGNLKVRRREWTATIDLNKVAIFNTSGNGIGVDIPMYVWGRKGNSGIGAYCCENAPNFQTRWTRVTSGTGVPESLKIPAIIHTNNLFVEVQTFQYASLDEDDEVLERIPQDEQIGFNISIFSKEPIPLSVDESKQNKITKKIDLYPNAAENILNVRVNNQTLPATHIQILDINGNIVLEKTDNLTFNNRIDISGLSSGIYLCRVKIGNNYVANKFTVVK